VPLPGHTEQRYRSAVDTHAGANIALNRELPGEAGPLSVGGRVGQGPVLGAILVKAGLGGVDQLDGSLFSATVITFLFFFIHGELLLVIVRQLSLRISGQLPIALVASLVRSVCACQAIVQGNFASGAGFCEK
jgi:hypothetical protein